MSEEDTAEVEQDYDLNSHEVVYCEGCGSLKQAPEAIRNEVTEPVHRVDLIEALGDLDEVGQTCATEEGDCGRCGSQVVRRYLFTGDLDNIPEPDHEPDEEDFTGRDPEEDALLETGPGHFEEVRELSWLKDGDSSDG